jgi:hypothetical protein
MMDSSGEVGQRLLHVEEIVSLRSMCTDSPTTDRSQVTASVADAQFERSIHPVGHGMLICRTYGLSACDGLVARQFYCR